MMAQDTDYQSRTRQSPLRLNLQIINQVPMFMGHSFEEDKFRSAFHLKTGPGDVIVNGFPKTGTTWMTHIVWQIVNDAAPSKSQHEMSYEYFPFLENMGAGFFHTRPHPWYIHTHLPYDQAPKHPEAKSIYIARNPKDACVSSYHFFKQFPGVFPKDMTFSDYVDNFLRGQVPYGNYFDHVIDWYEHRNDPNVFFITYEELKKDLRDSVLKIARFLGENREEKLVRDRDMLSRLLSHVTFDNMKKIPFYFNASKAEMPSEEELRSRAANIVQLDFFRKGIIGDWKNYFTEEQQISVDDLTLKHLGNTYFYEMWKNL